MLQTETLGKESLEIPREQHTADLASADACLTPNGDGQPEISSVRDFDLTPGIQRYLATDTFSFSLRVRV